MTNFLGPREKMCPVHFIKESSLFQDDPWLAFDLLGLPRPLVGTPIDRPTDLEYDTEDSLVLDVNTVPAILSLEDARKRPTATVLSAALHGQAGNFEAARIGVLAMRDLPKSLRRRYVTIILSALPKGQRKVLIGELPMQAKDNLESIERASGTFDFGRQEGRQEGLQEGQRITMIELVLAVLEVRGIPVDAASEMHIRSCEGLPTLQRWAQRARQISGISELFLQA